MDGVLVPRPNVRGREFVPDTYDVTISFNSQRFRGEREYSTQPDTGIIRLAMLGDSVTFGNGANDNQAYPFQLQSILRERLLRTPASGIPEVINAGIGGTGTAEQVLWYEHWVRQFHSQLVVLNVFCNDVDGDLQKWSFHYRSQRNGAAKIQKWDNAGPPKVSFPTRSHPALARLRLAGSALPGI